MLRRMMGNLFQFGVNLSGDKKESVDITYATSLERAAQILEWATSHMVESENVMLAAGLADGWIRLSDRLKDATEVHELADVESGTIDVSDETDQWMGFGFRNE